MTIKRLLVCVIMILCLLPAGGCTENETNPRLYSGMSVEQVEAIWGSSVGSDSYIGNLRWYVKDGHTSMHHQNRAEKEQREINLQKTVLHAYDL